MYRNGQIDLDEFVDVLDGAHRYDHYVVARCPFHDDSRPSFFVYEDKYRCLSCGAFGDTSRLLSKIKPSYAPVVQDTFHNPWTNWTKGHSLAFILSLAYKNRPSSYMIERGITSQVQSSLGIGKLDNWITFPIWDEDHNIAGAVARAGEGNNNKAKYMIPTGQNPNLLYVPSWKRVEKEDAVLLTFGIIDAVTLYMLGVASASTTTGKQINPSSFDHIRRKIIIIPDQGEEKEAYKLASQLGWRGQVAKTDFPDGMKDVNDLIWKGKYTRKDISAIIGVFL